MINNYIALLKNLYPRVFRRQGTALTNLGTSTYKTHSKVFAHDDLILINFVETAGANLFIWSGIFRFGEITNTSGLNNHVQLGDATNEHIKIRASTGRIQAIRGGGVNSSNEFHVFGLGRDAD